MKPESKSPKKSAIDLLILGLLMDAPRSAYDLANFIESRHLGIVLKISSPAVYKNCKKLYQEKFLDGEVSREKDLPEKITYSVNPRGKEHFYELMAHYSAEVKPFHFEHNSFIWNLEKIPKEEGLAMLQNLRASLVMLKKWIRDHEKEVKAMGRFGPLMLVRQYRLVFGALVRWITHVITEYKKL